MRPSFQRPTSTGPQILRSERGESAVSFLMLFVVVLLIAEIIVVGARVSGAQAVVANATRQAARQGSLVQTEAAAASVTDRVAVDNLTSHGNYCQQVTVADDSFIVPGGSVAVTVTCSVDLSDLSFLGLPLPDTVFTHTHTDPSRHTGR